MSFIINEPEVVHSAQLPTQGLTGSQIDGEVTLRLTRAIWTALTATNSQVAQSLKSSLSDEIGALQLQYEIDGHQNGDASAAIAAVLQHYLEHAPPPNDIERPEGC